jgi:hypothetical protein
MVTSTFHDRIEELRRRIGSKEGKITGEVIVDQVYAHYQHERLDLHHPRGGQALYLTMPLMLNHGDYLRDYAETVLDDGGREAMKRSVESLAEDGGVATYAPVEFEDLRRSGHPRVILGHSNVIYDRRPRQHRLSPEELKIKARLRKLPPEIIGYIWWHVMHHQEPPPHLGGRRR